MTQYLHRRTDGSLLSEEPAGFDASCLSVLGSWLPQVLDFPFEKIVYVMTDFTKNNFDFWKVRKKCSPHVSMLRRTTWFPR